MADGEITPCSTDPKMLAHLVKQTELISEMMGSIVIVNYHDKAAGSGGWHICKD